MQKRPRVEVEKPPAAAARIISGQRWVALATAATDGAPMQSYAPFAPAGSAFGIVASRLAGHTPHLLAGRPAAILLVDEGGAPGDAYARPRLSVAVAAVPHAPGSAEADAIWSALLARHGESVALLRTLSDFDAIALVPVTGRLILGFAAAYDLDAATLATALRRAS